jgi:hypothetical protein
MLLLKGYEFLLQVLIKQYLVRKVMGQNNLGASHNETQILCSQISCLSCFKCFFISSGLKIITPVLNFTQFYIYSNLLFFSKNRILFSWQWKFTRFYIYSVLICKIQRNICTVSLMHKVYLCKIGISLHVIPSESHVNEPIESQIQTHSQACHYVGAGTAIYFTTRLVADNIYTKLSIIYKHSKPLNWFLWPEIWKHCRYDKE